MKRTITILILLLMPTLLYGQGLGEERGPDRDGFAWRMAGGELGVLDFTDDGSRLRASGARDELAPWGDAAKRFLERRTDLTGGRGDERVFPTRVTADELGQIHVRLQEHVHGLPVVGADVILHAERATGRVLIVNGRFVPANDLPTAPTVEGWSAVSSAVAEMEIGDSTWVEPPVLTYVLNAKGRAFLAWSAVVAWEDSEGPHQDRIFADATTASLVARHPMIHHALNRKTYSANNGTSLPGTLLFNEGGSSSDTTAMAAYNNGGTTYNYYSSKHGRDSYNGSGATITQTVHYSSSYNNAYWNGSQMVYGDGDGSTFSPLSQALDVVAHELTHAVTEYEANLTYSYESGALNEAMSDVFGAATEAYSDGAVGSNTWKIGEDVYTPGTSGDALRYMNNPTADGSSYDYYPERYTGSQDNGGVHLNSGIANLAFYLLTQGGTHPRGKTSTSVPAIGLAKSEKIFYRALSVYMTSSTNFEGARTATAQAAQDLYGTTEANAVHAAWNAVGVPGGPVTVTTLSNGQTVSSLSGSTGSWRHYVITVPSGQTKLEIIQSGGTGDADLYVNFGSSPTTSDWDYRPYKSGNNETVTVTNPSAGNWYIGIYAYSTYSGVSLKATYTGSSGGGSCSGTQYSGSLSGAGKSQYQPNGSYYYSSKSGSHTAQLAGPASADFDLFLQKWNGSSWATVARSEGATSTESISYSGTSGYYRWRVYSYSGSGSYTLCTTKP